MSQKDTLPERNEQIEEQFNEYMMPIWKSLNVPIKEADGATVRDYEGNEYIDMFAGIAVTNVGHRNEAVIQAAKNQLDEFVHGCTYVHPHQPAAELSKTIKEITPGNLKKTFFANSGTEAVEGAVKLARKYTGSKEVIALEMAFHGRTLGSLSLTGNKAYKQEMAPTINDVAHIAPPYAYRCQRCDGGSCTTGCADDLRRVIDTHTSGDLAAVIVEPIMGEGGIIIPPKEWLKKIKNITHEYGGLLIADEVQTGYGRTGEMWGVDHFDIEPDIMSQAKGIANGLPLGAFTARDEIADAFESGDHLSTFGGNPVACKAALATIEELRSGIIENAASQGKWLGDRLNELEKKYSAVGQTRGVGLMYGVELVNPKETGPQSVAPAPAPELAKKVTTHLREQGIILGAGGMHSNVLRFQPPLTVTQEQLSRTVEEIDTALYKFT